MGCRTDLKKRLRIPNKFVREVLAEFLGTFILIAFGNGAVAQFTFGRQEYGDWNTLTWSWGIAVMMGVWVSGGVSGGHINPAITLAMCILGRTEWKKLIPYWLAQYLGAIVASACIYGVYQGALNDFDGGVRSITGPNATAGIFSTFPKEFLTAGNGFGDQVFSTGLLALCILAITDKYNMCPPKGMIPMCVGLIVVVIGQTYGFNCGYAINPARDLGPRIFTAMAGWGVEVFRVYDYWFWVPFIGPHVGAVIGAFLYQIFVGIHFDPNEEEEPEADYNTQETLSFDIRPTSGNGSMRGQENSGYAGDVPAGTNYTKKHTAYESQSSPSQRHSYAEQRF